MKNTLLLSGLALILLACEETEPVSNDIILFAEFSEQISEDLILRDNYNSPVEIKANNLTGNQLFAPKKDDGFFNVTGIPRFILLDREGKIIESVAKQPSELSLREQFAALE